MKKIAVVLLSFLLVFSNLAVYPAQAFAQEQALQQEFYSDPNNLLNLLPDSNTYQPIYNPMQGISSSVPNTSYEIPNSQVTPRSFQQEPPQMNNSIEPPVNVETGYLELAEKDVTIPQVLLPFNLERDYSSDNDSKGYFGEGWATSLDARLQMYAEFAIGESRIDGSVQSYEFVKEDPDAYVTEYDNDLMTNYELHKGYYESPENGDKLTRISQFEYVVETKDGTKYTYYGYYAPWRENQECPHHHGG